MNESTGLTTVLLCPALYSKSAKSVENIEPGHMGLSMPLANFSLVPTRCCLAQAAEMRQTMPVMDAQK